MAFQSWSSRPSAAARGSVRWLGAPCGPAQVVIPHGPAHGASGLARRGNSIRAAAGTTRALTLHRRHAPDVSRGLVVEIAGLRRASSGGQP